MRSFRLSMPPIRRLVPGLILMLGGLGLATAYFIVRPYLFSLTEDNTRSEITYNLNRLQGTLEYLLMQGDSDGIRREVAANSAHRDLKHLVVVDAAGKVLASSRLAMVGRPLESVGLHYSRQQLRQALESHTVRLERRSNGENTLYGIVPLRFPDPNRIRPDSWGAVLIELDMDQANRYLIQGIERIFLWVAGAILLFSLLLWLGFERLISRRLQSIGIGIAAIERDDYEDQLVLPGHDELAQISRAMDRLGRSLRQSHRDLSRQHAQFDSFMRHVPALVSIVDQRGIFRFVNDRFVANTGVNPGQEGLSLAEVYPPYLAQRHGDLNRQVLESGVPLQMEMSTGTGGDSRSWFLAKFPLGDATGDEALVGTVALDITQQEQSESLVRLTQSIFEHTAEGIIVTDAEQRIVEINRSFARISGYDKAALLGQTPAMFRSGDGDEAIYGQLRAALSSQGYWQGEMVNRHRDGSLLPLRLSISSIVDRDDRVSGYFAIYQDIRAEKRAEQALRELAYHDTLTGLYNRASFKQKIGDALERLGRLGEAFGVLFLDLDRFKEINDTLGHERGDELLGQVAQRIETQLRALDIACRLGGDEFIVLVPQVGAERELASLAQHLIEVLGRPFRVGDYDARIGCSIGIVVAPRDGNEIDTLMRNADAAMYHAKESGRGRYAFFDAEIDARNRRLMLIKQGLRTARQRGELSLVYQAELEPVHGEVVAYEALMRWDSAELGAVSPAEFIAVAEESDLIEELTHWLIQQVTTDALHPALLGSRIALNISPRQFRSESWLAQIRTAQAELGLDPRRLCIEVTESALVDDFEHARGQLQALKRIGVQVAIDDFGTGYSSLAYLKRLPIDYLKIDRSFVADIGQDADDQTIVSTVIVMAHELGIRVIAEGAETEAQVAFLRAQGCDLIQGYYYAKPLPLSELACTL